jgi:hypothetical protein
MTAVERLQSPDEPDDLAAWGRSLIGKLILVRLNAIDAAGEMLGCEILAGHVVRGDADNGVILQRIDKSAPECVYLPLWPQAFSLIGADIYQLSDDSVIKNPDFFAAFDVTQPQATL